MCAAYLGTRDHVPLSKQDTILIDGPRHVVTSGRHNEEELHRCDDVILKSRLPPVRCNLKMIVFLHITGTGDAAETETISRLALIARKTVAGL